MATLDSSIVIISLPAIFRGIHLDPLEPSNISYLLWMLMGYLVCTAVLVVTFGRLGDIFGRVRMYNAGFAVFTAASIALSLTPGTGSSAAIYLIVMRVVQGVGGAMLLANSTAIITDAFPVNERGRAMGINAIAAIAGSFVGLILGGVLADWDWRLVFWVNVPFGLFGTIWAYRKLRELGVRKPAKIDWLGNIVFAAGLISVLTGITYGIQPYGGHTMGWTSPFVLSCLIGGVALLVAFCWIELHVHDPMFNLRLFRIRQFASGNAAALCASVGRGGLQFMLIIWLQGIWLPLHGFSFESTPLWAGIFMIPLTIGLLVSAPIAGQLSDRYGARWFATGGMLLGAAELPAADDAARQLQLLGLRRAPVPERRRHRGVRAAQHHRHHELRPGRGPWPGVRHAGDVPERRDGAVDRHLLQPDDRRAVGPSADHDARAPHGRGREPRRRRPGRRRAARRQPLRRLPRLQPDADAARRARARRRPEGQRGPRSPARRSSRTSSRSRSSTVCGSRSRSRSCSS